MESEYPGKIVSFIPQSFTKFIVAISKKLYQLTYSLNSQNIRFKRVKNSQEQMTYRQTEGRSNPLHPTQQVISIYLIVQV